MIKLNWTYHLGRSLLGLALALILGWWTGHILLVPSLFLAAYLAWHLYNSFRLHQWLHSWDTEPPESLGMWAEIFEKIAALQKLNRKRDQQYQQVIDDFTGMADAFPDATLVIDRHDVIRWFNDSAVRLLGLQTSADRGQTVTNLIRDPAFAEWLAVQGELSSTLDITCPGNDNIVLQLSEVRFGKEQRMIILRDVTDVRNLERMRRELVANVSHELRTPLTVMLGYLEVLKSQPEEANGEAIERMFTQAGQMNDLIEDLLELSRLEDDVKDDGLVAVDVPAMLAQLAEQAEDLSNGKHKIRFKIEAGLNMRGVEADLKSAFQNLITNAINYTPRKGQVRVSWQETGKGLVFTVADSGIGIPFRDIPRVTERFYRVGDDRNRKTGGTGLGLAIVKHVLHSHEAELKIKSEHGKGSEFSCVFPLERKA